MEKKYLWTNNNIKEVLPGVNPPFVTSTVTTLINPVFNEVLGTEASNKEMIKDINGRLYFNGTLITEGVEKRYHLSNISLADFFGGETTKKPSLKTIPLKGKIRVLQLIIKIIIGALFLEKRYRQVLQDLEKVNKRYEKKVAAITSFEQALAVYKTEDKEIRQIFFETLKTLIPATASFYLFTKLSKKWLRDETGSKANDLLALGSKESQMIEVFACLWKLSEEIKENKKILEKFQSVQTNSELANFLAEFPQVAGIYNEFIEKFGYRCAQELNISLPRWREDPSFIIQNLKGYIKADKSKNPLLQLENTKKRQRLALEYARKNLSWWQFLFLKYLLQRNMFLIFGREEGKSQLVRSFYSQRQCLLLIGQYLQEIEVLEDKNDIFMLLNTEVDSFKRDWTPNEKQELRRKIHDRKKEYEKNKKLPPKDVIDETGKYQELLQDNKLSPGPIIKGMGVSGGIITGTVKVIETPQEIWKLEPGEILVTDHTDPGWTPVFVVAGGVITNTGGMLSHASIIAREYGIPAVVNTGNATKVLKDGQKIILDGIKGTVEIIQ